MSYSLFKNSKVKLLSPIEAICTCGLHAIKHKLQNRSELGLKRGRWGTGVRPRRPRQHLRAHGCALPVPGPAPVLSPEHPTTCHSDSVTPTPGPPSTLPLSRGTSPRPRPSARQQRPLCLPPQADPAGSCTNAPSAPWCKTPDPNAHPRAPGPLGSDPSSVAASASGAPPTRGTGRRLLGGGISCSPSAISVTGVGSLH